MIRKIYFRELGRVYSMIYKEKIQYFITILITGLAYPCIQIMCAFASKNAVNAVEYYDYTLFTRACLLVLGTIIIQCIIEPIANCYNGCLVNRTIYHIRTTVYEHLEKLPVSYFETHHSGDTMSRVTVDIEKFEPIYRGTARNLMQAIFYGFGSLISMIIINYKLAIYSLLFSIIVYFSNTVFTNVLRRLGEENQKKISRLTQAFLNIYTGSTTAKIFNKENYLTEKFTQENTELTKLGITISKTNVAKDTINFGLTFLSRMGALILGLLMVTADEIDIGSVVGIVTLQAGVTSMFVSIGGFFANLQSGLAGVSRIFEILDMQEECSHYEIQEVNNLKKEDVISFEDVSFSYDGKNDVLNNIQFTMQKDKIYAVVGVNGSGKSTLTKLLLGFYQPQGKVSFFGKALKEYNLNELRNQITYVSQRPVLFSTSILENIRYGKMDATMEEVIKAAKIAGIHDFIESLDHGYDTDVGDKGTFLSGGQKQRIVIARAVIKSSPVIIFDEATSSLDNENEVFIVQFLKEIAKDKIIIIIAHRLHSIQNADWIYVMEGGKMQEQGVHEQLMEKRGTYRKLYDLQLLADVDSK